MHLPNSARGIRDLLLSADVIYQRPQQLVKLAVRTGTKTDSSHATTFCATWSALTQPRALEALKQVHRLQFDYTLQMSLGNSMKFITISVVETFKTFQRALSCFKRHGIVATGPLREATARRRRRNLFDSRAENAG